MTARQWSLVGILVFLNGFIFTILFMLVKEIYLAPRPVERAIPTATSTATFAPSVTPTYTPTPILTPTPTNTRVVPPTTPTPKPTRTPTPLPPTPASPPTPILPPATPTPIPTPTPTLPPATPTPAYQSAAQEPRYSNSCQRTQVTGIVRDTGGNPVPGVTIRSWLSGNFYMDKTTTAGGGYEFYLCDGPCEREFAVAVVGADGNLASRTVIVKTSASDCGGSSGRQLVAVDFVKNW